MATNSTDPTDRYIDLLAAVIHRARLDAQGRPICTRDSGSAVMLRYEAAAFLTWARRELAPVADVQALGVVIETKY